MKKIAGALLAVIMAVSLFAGCGGNNVSSNGDEQPAEENQSVEANTASAKVTVDGTKFVVDGKELWINGVNTPWQNWNDFNGGMDEQFWDETFAQLKEDKINCTRIWINCNGNSIVRLKTTGEFKSVNENHWTDLDKLFAIAEKYQVYIMPTLLSFDHFKDGNGGVESWRAMISDKTLSDSFADNYVAEFAKRYGDNEYLFGIDLMNEPDWVKENKECGQIGWDKLSYFFGKCAEVIHENSTALVTVGVGMIKYNSEQYDGNMLSDAYLKELTGSDKAYLDFYSPHYYIWEKQWYGFPFDKSPAEFGLEVDRPCIIAETSNDDEAESGMSAAEKYKTCYEKGWNGVMVWMEYRADGSSGCDSMWYRYDLTQAATHGMYEIIPEKIFPLED